MEKEQAQKIQNTTILGLRGVQSFLVARFTDLFQVHDLRVQVRVLYSQVQVQVPVAQVLLRVLLTSTRVIVLIAKHTWARRTTVPLTYITLVRCGSAIAKVRYSHTIHRG